MDFFSDHAVLFALICAGVGIGYGIMLTSWVLARPAGSERMREISRAVQEGAAAYLKRQYMTIAVVANPSAASHCGVRTRGTRSRSVA